MAKIPGWVYIGVGLFISILSFVLNYRRFIFFFYAGLIFVIGGVVKTSLNFFDKNNQVKPQNTRPSVQNRMYRQVHRFKRCRKCGNIVGVNDSFCGRCGFRI